MLSTNFSFFETLSSSLLFRNDRRCARARTSRRPTPRYARRRRRERLVPFFSHARDGWIISPRAPIPTIPRRRTDGRSIAPRTPASGCDLFRRAGGPAREMRSIVIPRRSRTTRATRFDAVKRDETMRENVTFFFPSRPGGFERETRRDGDAGGAGEITIGRRRCRDLTHLAREEEGGWNIFF